MGRSPAIPCCPAGYALHPWPLGRGRRCAEGHDAPGLGPLQRLPELGLGPHRLALDRDDDVGTAALGIVVEHVPRRASGCHARRPTEPARVRRHLELLYDVGRHRLYADPQAAHGCAGRGVGVVGVALRVGRRDLGRVVQRLELDVEGLTDAALAGHLDLDHIARPVNSTYCCRLADDPSPASRPPPR